jgi:hypothetical protein
VLPWLILWYVLQILDELADGLVDVFRAQFYLALCALSTLYESSWHLLYQITVSPPMESASYTVVELLFDFVFDRLGTQWKKTPAKLMKRLQLRIG